MHDHLNPCISQQTGQQRHKVGGVAGAVVARNRHTRARHIDRQAIEPWLQDIECRAHFIERLALHAQGDQDCAELEIVETSVEQELEHLQCHVVRQTAGTLRTASDFRDEALGIHGTSWSERSVASPVPGWLHTCSAWMLDARNAAID